MIGNTPESDPHGLRLDEQQLRDMSTADLIRHAMDEARLLARAEVLHAKHELRAEVSRAKTAGGFLGAAAVLTVCGLSVLFMALAAALGLPIAVGAVIVGASLLIASGALALVGRKRVPNQPLARTQQRLKEDLHLTREQLS